MRMPLKIKAGLAISCSQHISNRGVSLNLYLSL